MAILADWKARIDRLSLFQRCLVGSFLLHAVFLLWGRFIKPAFYAPPPVEVDLTMPTLGGGPAKLGAPKRQIPGAKGLPKPADNTLVPLKPAPAAAPPKDWVLPGPQTKVVEKAPEPAATPGGAPDGSGTAAKTGGSGLGADDGVPGGTGTGGSGLVQFPRLLNRDELMANMRRFYPEGERRAEREGSVVLALHISVEGKVEPGEVISSAGAAFNAAAKEVARRMRFSPALGRHGPVPVKMPQSFVFQLED
ncbi:MAG: TonB family protein [Elusimicrobiota bacterium]|jgi:TonB family protein